MPKEFNERKLHELINYEFEIPYYQRGYRWTSDNINILLTDLFVFLTSKDDSNNSYFMQPLAVSKQKENTYLVIDGQQRLTTYYILYNYLCSKLKLTAQKKWYTFTYAKDKDNGDNEKINDLLNKIPNFLDKKEEENLKSINNINEYYIRNAYYTIEKWFKYKDEGYLDSFYTLLTSENRNGVKIDKSIYFLWYEVSNTIDGHLIFQNLNSNKIQLTNSDLIKALLLSESTGLDNRYQVATQFEEMERRFSDGRFWFMLSNKDVRSDKGQSRIDLLFNYTLKIYKITDSKYVNDPRITFNSMMKKTKTKLAEDWKTIRRDFQVLLDFFDNVEYSHYLGYLSFASKDGINIHDYIIQYLTNSKSDFLSKLKEKVANTLMSSNIDDYNYKIENKELQKLFVLHNVQTIISRYNHLKKSIRYYYEYFPFELLYPLSHWNIEHIESQTINDLKDPEDRNDWLNTIFCDYKDNTEVSTVKERFFRKISNEEYSDELFIDLLLHREDSNFASFKNELEKTINSLNKNNPELQEITNNKDQIGNLVLLDGHINKSFHNAIFARKRRIVLMSSGLINQEEADKYKMEEKDFTYMPVCTRDVYMKAYNKSHNLKFNSWTQGDCDAYKHDIEEKLHDFFVIKANS